MTAYGVPEADVARVLRSTPRRFGKHYRDELDTGAIKATAKVAEFLFRKATTEGAAMRHGGDLLAEDPRPLEGNQRARAERSGRDQAFVGRRKTLIASQAAYRGSPQRA